MAKKHRLNFSVILFLGLNLVVMYFAIMFVLSPFWAWILPWVVLIFDLAMFMNTKDELDQSDYDSQLDSTALFFVWLIISLANVFLICAWLAAIYQLNLIFLTAIGIIYFVLKVLLFIILPIYKAYQ